MAFITNENHCLLLLQKKPFYTYTILKTTTLSGGKNSSAE
jgi:hypothetical protein